MASPAPGWPPSEATSRPTACCCWKCRAGSPAACFLQLSKHGWLGRKPLVGGPAPKPLSQQGNNGLDGLGVRGRASPSVPCSYQQQGQVAGRSAPPSPPHGSCFPRCWAHCLPPWGQGKQRPQEMSLDCCWGSAALGASRAGGGDREGPVSHRPHSAWGCS